MWILFMAAILRSLSSSRLTTWKTATGVIGKSIQETTWIDPQHSIAVMPFMDLSEKKEHGYLADGLAEDLIDSGGRAIA